MPGRGNKQYSFGYGTSEGYIPPLPSASTTKTKSVHICGVEIPLLVANIAFAFFVVAGQVGQNVSLPLWVDSTNKPAGPNEGHHANGTISNGTTAARPSVDSYFVLTFASLSFVVIFGFLLVLIRIFAPHKIGETERKFPQLLLFLIGMFDALNGVLVVFASSGKRTAPYLQAILGNFSIPLTLLVRFLILRKVPTIRKFLCALAVVVSLFVCLLPTIFPKLDSEGKKDLGGASGVAGVLWPLCFMLGFTPAAVMNVLEEKGLKMQDDVSRKGVNIVYMLFWTSLYQLLTAGCLFWVDIVPGYGNAKNIREFGKNWWFGIQCFFGGAGCSTVCGTRGSMFILMYVLSYVGGANLLRYAEGATLLAIVTSLVTPLGFLFWTMFQEDPFQWHPQGHVSTWFSIGGLALMVPAIFLYNTGPPEIIKRQQVNVQATFSDTEQAGKETDPLLVHKDGQAIHYVPA